MTPRHLIGNADTVRKAVEYVEEKLSLTNSEDWYRVSRRQLESLGMWAFFKRHGGLHEILSQYRPEQTWVESNFTVKKVKRHHK